MTNNEKILKRALEMACGNFICNEICCPVANGTCHYGKPKTGVCSKVITKHFIRKAKEAICKGN